MKIIQVTDLHLVAPGERLFGLDPLSRLEDCIADLNRNHADADLVVFCGDLTDNGDPLAYAALSQRLATLAAPHRLMLGNHDDRAAFRAAFPQTPTADGFVQSVVDLPAGRIVLLDTLEPGQVQGRLCELRLGWLDAALGEAQDALLFMHHPPFPIGVPSLDDSRLADSQRLAQLLGRRGNVRHIFAGHVHRFANGSWCGIPFTTLRGTNHQSALKLSGPHEVSFEAPAYGVILADSDGVTVHPQEFAFRA